MFFLESLAGFFEIFFLLADLRSQLLLFLGNSLLPPLLPRQATDSGRLPAVGRRGGGGAIFFVSLDAFINTYIHT